MEDLAKCGVEAGARFLPEDGCPCSILVSLVLLLRHASLPLAGSFQREPALCFLENRGQTVRALVRRRPEVPAHRTKLPVNTFAALRGQPIKDGIEHESGAGRMISEALVNPGENFDC